MLTEVLFLIFAVVIFPYFVGVITPILFVSIIFSAVIAYKTFHSWDSITRPMRIVGVSIAIYTGLLPVLGRIAYERHYTWREKDLLVKSCGVKSGMTIGQARALIDDCGNVDHESPRGETPTRFFLKPEGIARLWWIARGRQGIDIHLDHEGKVTKVVPWHL